MKRITHILLDNGHGSDTPGKSSPVWSDGRQVFEWEYTRRLVSAISAKLAESGIPVRIITPETTDTPLYIRVNRVNQIARSVGAGSCLLISVHLNAARETNTGSGWEVHTSLGSTASDIYADQFWDAANKEIRPLTRMRGDYSDGDRDWDSNFYILQKTICPAILTENLFMNRESDCRILLSKEGFERLVRLHVTAIRNIIDKKP